MNNEMWRKTIIQNRVRCGAFFLIALLNLIVNGPVHADDPFGKQETESSHMSETLSLMALDQVKWNRPQAVFTWITMARGYKTPWDSVGRPGWMTDDAYVEPVDPGVSVFPPSTAEIYIVFEGQPLDAPGQFAAAWYELQDGKVVSDVPVGKDIIELEMNQRYGYFILTPPQEGWNNGKYLVEVYYGSPGQQLHATNIVGTMEFTITDQTEPIKGS